MSGKSPRALDWFKGKALTIAGVLGTKAYINYFQVGDGNYKQVRI